LILFLSYGSVILFLKTFLKHNLVDSNLSSLGGLPVISKISLRHQFQKLKNKKIKVWSEKPVLFKSFKSFELCFEIYKFLLKICKQLRSLSVPGAW